MSRELTAPPFQIRVARQLGLKEVLPASCEAKTHLPELGDPCLRLHNHIRKRLKHGVEDLELVLTIL